MCSLEFTIKEAGKSTGVFLKGDGKGRFKAIPSAKSGFYSAGDNRDIALFNNQNNETTIWIGRNSNTVKVFKTANGRRLTADGNTQ